MSVKYIDKLQLMIMDFFNFCSELGLIVFEIDPKGCAARDGRVQVRVENSPVTFVKY